MSRNTFIQPVVLAIIKKDSKYLLTLRTDIESKHLNFHNHWQIPGGGLEFAEDPEATVVREAKEELGLDIEIVKMVPKIYNEVRGGWQGLFISFVCKMKHEDQEIHLNEEASQYGWFTVEELKKLPLMPLCDEVIELADNL